MTNEINWVECNLPWYKSINYRLKEYPNELGDIKSKEKFGYTRNECCDIFRGKDEYFNKRNELRTENPGASDEFILEKFKEFGNEDFVKCFEYNVLSLKIDEYMYSLSEFIAVQEENFKIIEAEKVTSAKECFSKSPFCRPGVLIGTEKGVELIGSMNEAGGVCDDCVAFKYDTIIKRYAVVFNFNEVKE